MHVIAHHSLKELQRLQETADRPAMVLKLRALRLARDGWAHKRIAEALGKPDTTTSTSWGPPAPRPARPSVCPGRT